MKRNNGVKFVALILFIGILTYLAAFGANISGFKIKSAKDIVPGIDINGGVHTTLYPKGGIKPSGEDLEKAKNVIERRLDNKNIFDRSVTTDKANGRVIVEIPWPKDEKDFNPQKTVDELVATAKLTFQEVDENKKDANGKYLPTGKVIVNGDQVTKSVAVSDPTQGICVSLEFNNDGTKKFAEATGRLIGKPIAIFMDDQLISWPNVQVQITNGKAVITNQETIEEASKLANTIASGSIPFSLEARQVSSISATLGASALAVSIQAFVVSFILVCLFMLCYYRLSGLLACIALVAHTVLQLLAISWLGITMTLPGIAGIILTVGMGVDANVIIFERIKEELRNGKTLRAAIDIGFKRAFAAVFDANMTTLITAVVLFIFGSGPIKGFAYTLGLGVLLSFFTAVTVSRIMLKSVANVDIAKHHWLYGA